MKQQDSSPEDRVQGAADFGEGTELHDSPVTQDNLDQCQTSSNPGCSVQKGQESKDTHEALEEIYDGGVLCT